MSRSAHKAVLQQLYESFVRRDGDAMARCYHPRATFSDPVFTHLEGEAVGQMWRMLCQLAPDLRIAFGEVEVTDDGGSVAWEAWYRFSRTGRPVHNRIRGHFRFSEGLILEHRDEFSFWRWTRMALGAPGWLLGWTPLVQSKIRAQAMKGLAAFSAGAGSKKTSAG